MITVNSQGQALTQAYADAVKGDDRVFLARVSMNGTELNGDVVSLSITKGSCGGAEFEVGAVMSNTLNLQMLNLTDNVKGQDLKVEIGLEVNGSMEYITVGYFTATEVKRTHYNTNITGYGYSVSKTGDIMPTVASQVLSDLRNELSSATGVNVTYDPAIDTSLEITKDLAGLTIYQVFQVVASVVGGYVKDDASGAITIKVYDDTPTLSVDAGMMVKLPDAEEYDFTITGVQCTAGETVYQSGTVNVEMENEYMTQDLFTDCASNLIGYSYRPATINLSVGDPRLEGDDVLTVTDIDNTTYVVPCHQITHKYTGGFSSDIESIRATMIENSEATSAPISTQLKQQEKQIARVDRIASNTDQYFWFTSQGTDTGAHITEIPQEDFKARTAVDPTDGGGNLLARSNGIAVRDGLTELATFGTTGIQLGQSGQSKVNLDYHSFTMNDKDGNEYANITDLRNEQGVYEATDTFTGDGATTIFRVSYAIDTNYAYTVKVDGATQVEGSDFVWLTASNKPNRAGFYVHTTDTAIDPTKKYYRLYNGGMVAVVNPVLADLPTYYEADPPSEGAVITLLYTTTSANAKAYTFGKRSAGSNMGGYSLAEGYDSTASGFASHCEGYGCTAEGIASHCEGYTCEAKGRSSHAEGENCHAKGQFSHAGGYITYASSESQTAIGTKNIEDTQGKFALIIGNGGKTSYGGESASNALAVKWRGDVEMFLDHNGSSSANATGGDDKELFNTIRALGWYSDVIV